MLPGVSSDAITSVKPTSRWMQTLGRRESPQRALQDCKENASLESVVENSCDRGLHATTAPHERTLFVKAQNQVRMRTDRLAAMTFSTGHSKKGQGSTVRSVSREAMSWACISIISCCPDHGACRASRRHNLHPRAIAHPATGCAIFSASNGRPACDHPEHASAGDGHVRAAHP